MYVVPRRRLTGLPLALLLITLSLATAQEPVESERGPDWIPVGAVRPEVARRAMTARARFETGDAGMQRQALTAIEADIPRYGRAALQTAAVPLIVDLLGTEYRILETPRPLTLEPGVRLQALRLLSTLGGQVAREQLRRALHEERDPSLRAAAAAYLADMPGAAEDDDYRAISDALAAAVRRGDGETEIMRLLPILESMSREVWSPEYRPLLESLVSIAGGRYSSSARSRAMSFLEDLSER